MTSFSQYLVPVQGEIIPYDIKTFIPVHIYCYFVSNSDLPPRIKMSIMYMKDRIHTDVQHFGTTIID